MFDCMEQTASSPAWIFVAFAIVMNVVVARHNGFGPRESLQAAIGRKSYLRSPVINWLQLATLSVPLVLWVVLILQCRGAAGG